MPWKGEKDPYKIWLSEIMLQQTRVEQGINYYNTYVKKFPTIKKLAAAPLQEVMMMWQGLGYYSRCRNLHTTAIEIANRGGQFPSTYKEILQLKGIGEYTAAAIASFAFNLPHAVVDGNVYRIFSRFLGESTPIDTTDGKKLFKAIAQQCLPKNNPGEYNQALMDFGATICKPKAALCTSCPLNKDCVAYNNNNVYSFPVKNKKLKRKERYFHYLVIDDGKNIYLQQRVLKDIWQSLFEFYLIETDTKYINNKNFKAATLVHQSKQTLTHQDIFSFYYTTHKATKNFIHQNELIKVPYKQLNNYAFPKTVLDFLKKNEYLIDTKTSLDKINPLI